MESSGVLSTFVGTHMDTLTYTTARKRLAEAMDRVCDEHQPLIITRAGHHSVVLMSLADYKTMEETAYLLRSPCNASRLLAATKDLRAVKGNARS